MSLTTAEKIRSLQRKLYLKAKQVAGRDAEPASGACLEVKPIGEPDA